VDTLAPSCPPYDDLEGVVEKWARGQNMLLIGLHFEFTKLDEFHRPLPILLQSGVKGGNVTVT
jgi:hypothetical protein